MAVKVADGPWCNVLVEFTDGKTKIFENCYDFGYETTRQMFEIVVDGWRTFIPREVVKYVHPYDIPKVEEKEEKEEYDWKDCLTCKHGPFFYKCTVTPCCNYDKWEARK